MEKLRYDSLYKFIVSVGIVIMILPFVFCLDDIVIIKESVYKSIREENTYV